MPPFQNMQTLCHFIYSFIKKSYIHGVSHMNPKNIKRVTNAGLFLQADLFKFIECVSKSGSDRVYLICFDFNLIFTHALILNMPEIV